jgi:hypothetical protein
MFESSMNNELAQADLDHTMALAGLLLDLADASVAQNDREQALIWTHVASKVLTSQNRELFSPRVERSLRLFGGWLPPFSRLAAPAPAHPGDKQRWLHVINQALPYGGHTPMATLWMQGCRGGRTHSVALLMQKTAAPDELAAAVRDSGGSLHTAPLDAPLLDRARWLRTLAASSADYVLLHVDPDDVIAPTAFAAEGGPPVLLFNHAAHIYWNGASIPDVIVNCRGSKLEEQWTRVHRGALRCATVPIPLLTPGEDESHGVGESARKERARQLLGLPKDAVVMLTSGDSYKFAPLGRLDFIAVCEDILRRLPQAILVAIGPVEDERWLAARERTGSRLRTFGRQPRSQVPIFLQAADVYIEGFPFGSTTALLEAGLRGIPVVLAPAQCPPPYGTDGVALDDVLERSCNFEEYKSQIIALCQNSRERAALGARLRDSIQEHHTASGWRNYVEEAIRIAPRTHSTSPIAAPVPTPADVHLHWSAFRRATFPDFEHLVENMVRYAFGLGARPLPPEQAGRAARSRIAARLYAEIAEQFQGRGDVVAAKRFYACSVSSDPWLLKIRVRKLLLSLGPTGALLRRVARRFKAGRTLKVVNGPARSRA